ncbi:hypothetical protein [Dysosmobacter sp.]
MRWKAGFTATGEGDQWYLLCASTGEQIQVPPNFSPVMDAMHHRVIEPETLVEHLVHTGQEKVIADCIVTQTKSVYDERIAKALEDCDTVELEAFLEIIQSAKTVIRKSRKIIRTY